MRHIVYFIATLLVTAPAVPAISQVIAPEEQREFRSAVDRLLDNKTVRVESQRLIDSYLRSTHVVGAALRDHLKDHNHRTPLALIEAVRMLRVIDSARSLAEIVDAQSPGSFESGPLSSYPAAQALAGFGSIGFSDIMSRLGHEASEKQLRLFALIFLTVDGKELASFRVQKELRDYLEGSDFQGENHPRTKNLRRLAEIINTIDFTKQENWPARIK